MAVTLQLKNQHLLWRAGFGTGVPGLESFSSLRGMVSTLLKSSEKKPVYIDVAGDLAGDYAMVFNDAMKARIAGNQLSDEEKKNKQQQLRRENRDRIKTLNLTWLNEMAVTDAPLREKMALFWHGHFACRQQNAVFQQLLLDNIRNNALGSFRELLMQVSKSAAMLAFLNNQQNRKQHPNENFAREVMELFTLGRGNYTENDVKEAARAFTGWGFNLKGEFTFRKFQHDDGTKTVLGKSGNFDGDDVLNILLDQKQTSVFITRKVYRYFVNDNADEAKVKWLAGRFYQSDYNIQSLMKDIFSADWFYAAENVGVHIKSPVELLAGMRRTLGIELENEEVQLLMQRALGQVLFYPPNVAGWPGGKSWIDSSTLMLRLKIPQLIKDNQAFNVTPKTDDDQMMGMTDEMKKIGNRFRINAKVDWPAYLKQFEDVPREKLYDALEAHILQTPPGSVNRASIEKVTDISSRENYIKTLTIALMSTPEYQLC